VIDVLGTKEPLYGHYLDHPHRICCGAFGQVSNPGPLVATYGGQMIGFYRAGEPAGFLGSLVGAIILLVIYHLVRRNPTA